MQPEQPSAPLDPLAEAKRAFEAAYAGPDGWETRLQRSEKNNVLASLSNVVAVLTRHDEWKGVIGYDAFSGRLMKLRKPPVDGADVGEWSDLDDGKLRLWLSGKYRIEPKREVIMEAVSLCADRNRFHQVREYLDALAWDGVPRLRLWLAEHMGATITPYVMAAGSKWLISAVARIYVPGCKADHVLIFEGKQGVGKSSALRILGGDWFTDAPFRLGDREGDMITRGKWMVELSELDSLNKAETAAAKAFFSSSSARYRGPWEKRPSDVPRQCVFAGTVNHQEYLRDDSGNRRYWPVRIATEEDVDLDGLAAVRDQLWAEAVVEFRAGVPWMPTRDEREMFEVEQDERYIGDAWQERVEAWLAKPDDDGIARRQVNTSQLLAGALGLDAGKWTLAEQQRLGRVMRRIAWPKRRIRAAGGLQWVYERPDGPDDDKGRSS